MEKKKMARKVTIVITLWLSIIFGFLAIEHIYKNYTYEEVTGTVTEKSIGRVGKKRKAYLDIEYEYNSEIYEKKTTASRNTSLDIGDSYTLKVNPENPSDAIKPNSLGFIFVFAICFILFIAFVRAKPEDIKLTINGVEVE